MDNLDITVPQEDDAKKVKNAAGYSTVSGVLATATIMLISRFVQLTPVEIPVYTSALVIIYNVAIVLIKTKI
jgi:hypothetical protein